MRPAALAFLLLSTSCSASEPAVPYEVSPTVAEFLRENGTDFSAYKASFASADEVPGGFHTMTDVYKTTGAVDDVFGAFIGLSPKQAWAGSAAFDLLYDRKEDAVYDRGARRFPPIREGQVVLLTLKIFAGCRIPVAFEFVKVDQDAHELQFSYLEGNKSRGVQIVRFSQSGKDVVATHTSRFLSDSPWRDKNLYPHFHRKLLDDFYRQVFAQVGGRGPLQGQDGPSPSAD